MSEKVAVQCQTLELFLELSAKLGRTLDREDWERYEGQSCIAPDSCWADKEWYKRNGYKIISASEYLGGGESVEQEFKVGDEVEVTQNVEHAWNHTGLKEGQASFIDKIGGECSHGGVWIYIGGMGIASGYLKLVSNNKKEEVTMADTIIKDVIFNHYEKGADAKVVQRYFGSQIADDINGEYLLIDHGTEILKRAKDAEKKYLKDNS